MTEKVGSTGEMRMSRRQVPVFGIIASTALASIAMLINYLGSSGATVFTTLPWC